MTIIFHPSNITYDYSIAKTWEQYRKRNKRNKRVKEFRKAIWLPENRLEVYNHTNELSLWTLAWFNVFTKK